MYEIFEQLLQKYGVSAYKVAKGDRSDTVHSKRLETRKEYAQIRKI